MHRRFVMAAILAVGLLALSSPVASAVQPYHGTWGAVGTDTIPAGTLCSFDVTIHYEVTGEFSIYFKMPEDYAARAIEWDVAQDTFSANGKTLAGEPYKFVGLTTYDTDGYTYTSMVIVGAIERVPLPDGTVFWSVGRYDLFAHGFVGAIVPDKGHSGNVDAFCAALAP